MTYFDLLIAQWRKDDNESLILPYRVALHFADKAEQLEAVLRETVQFVRDYPLGVEDARYAVRRDRILCSEVIRDWLDEHKGEDHTSGAATPDPEAVPRG